MTATAPTTETTIAMYEDDETPAAPIAAYAEPMTHAEAAKSLQDFGSQLSGQFVERNREVRGLLLATIARENILLLGPPGTAKSALTVAFSQALGWKSFVRLLSAQTVPEELFGPWDLSGLGEKPSRFERVVDGYLPTAQVGFLDEIFKANSAILNSLLTILNERQYDQGPVRMYAPLEVAVGASNEYPQDGQLAALYDRFMLRFWVEYIKDEGQFSAMLAAPAPVELSVDPQAIEILRSIADTVDASTVIPAVVKIRNVLATEHGITISDRRWRKALGIVRAAAALAGRTVANAHDLGCLVDCLWDRHEQADVIRKTVMKYGNPKLAKAREYRLVADNMIQEAIAGRDLSSLRTSELTAMGKALAQLRSVNEEARRTLAAEIQADPEIRAEVEEIMILARKVKAAINKAAGLELGE